MNWLPDPRRSGGFIAMAAMAALAFLILGTATIAPWWATTLMAVMWLALFASTARRFSSRPLLVLVFPLIGYAVWQTTILVGTHHWGWGRG